MKEITPLEEAECRLEYRKLYKSIGSEKSLQVLYDLIKSAQILNEIILEEELRQFKGEHGKDNA